MANDPHIITDQFLVDLQAHLAANPQSLTQQLWDASPHFIISRVQDTWPPPEGVPVYVTMRDDGTVYWERADGK